MNNIFQKLAHNSWDNAVQAFLNMKINAEKIYKAAKGKDFGPFSAIWKVFKTAWGAFRVAMLAVKLAPILIPIIKSTLGAFL